MEIITYVLEGELEHRDSTGSHGIVGPGGTQFMSAGTGIRHSEFNHSKEKPLHLLQMWVVPGRVGTAPTYGQVEFRDDERRNKLLAVASGREGVAAPVRLTQDAAFFVTRLEDGHKVRHTFEPGRLGFAFVAEGSAHVRVAHDQMVDDVGALHTGDAVRLANVERVELDGPGLVVLWDVPPIAEAGDA